MKKHTNPSKQNLGASSSGNKKRRVKNSARAQPQTKPVPDTGEKSTSLVYGKGVEDHDKPSSSARAVSENDSEIESVTSLPITEEEVMTPAQSSLFQDQKLTSSNQEVPQTTAEPLVKLKEKENIKTSNAALIKASANQNEDPEKESAGPESFLTPANDHSIWRNKSDSKFESNVTITSHKAEKGSGNSVVSSLDLNDGDKHFDGFLAADKRQNMLIGTDIPLPASPIQRAEIDQWDHVDANISSILAASGLPATRSH
jgi:hypothetical protein